MWPGLLAELASYGHDADGGLIFFLLAGDLAHGVMEGEAQHTHEEVNSIAGQVAFGPAPIAVFDDQTGIGGQDKITRLAWDDLDSALLQQGNQQDLPGRADLLAGPARRWIRRGRGCHSLSSNEVEPGRG